MTKSNFIEIMKNNGELRALLEKGDLAPLQQFIEDLAANPQFADLFNVGMTQLYCDALELMAGRIHSDPKALDFFAATFSRHTLFLDALNLREEYFALKVGYQAISNDKAYQDNYACDNGISALATASIAAMITSGIEGASAKDVEEEVHLSQINLQQGKSLIDLVADSIMPYDRSLDAKIAHNGASTLSCILGNLSYHGSKPMKRAEYEAVADLIIYGQRSITKSAGLSEASFYEAMNGLICRIALHRRLGLQDGDLFKHLASHPEYDVDHFEYGLENHLNKSGSKLINQEDLNEIRMLRIQKGEIPQLERDGLLNQDNDEQTNTTKLGSFII